MDTTYSMSDDWKPEWYEQVREYPIQWLFLLVGLVTGAAVVVVQYRFAYRSIGFREMLTWSIPLIVVLFLVALAMAKTPGIIDRYRQRHERSRRQGFQVEPKDKK